MNVAVAGGIDSSAIGVPTGTRGVLRNGRIAVNSQPFSKGFLRLRRPAVFLTAEREEYTAGYPGMVHVSQYAWASVNRPMKMASTTL